MSEYKACKDCKHFHSNGYNHNHVCFRPREKTIFDPVNGVMLEGPRLDVFAERNSESFCDVCCGVSGFYFEAVDK